MDKLAVLQQELKDLNPQKLQEVEHLAKEGTFLQLDGQQLCKVANSYFVELNFLSAAGIFVQSFERLQNDPEYLYGFGYFLFETGFLDLSEQMLKRSVELAPEGQFRKYCILGEMYKAIKPAIALQLFQKGIELSQKQCEELGQDLTAADKNAETERGRKIENKIGDNKRTISQAYCTVAEIMMNQPEFPKNRSQIEAALQYAEAADPTYLEPIYQRCFLFFNVADETSCRKEIDKFVKGIKEVERKNDEDLLDYPAEMLVAIVRMMIEGAIWAQGAYLAEIAVTNNHTNYEALYMLAFCSLNMRDMETCKDAIDKLSSFNLDHDTEIKEAFAELKEEYQIALKEEQTLQAEGGAAGGDMMEEPNGDDWEDDGDDDASDEED